MTCDEAMRFLRRKLDLIVENTPSEASEAKLLEYWIPLFEGIDLAKVKLKELQALDRGLDKNFRKFLLREDQADLRDQLVSEFGLDRLTAAALKAAGVGEPSADELVFIPAVDALEGQIENHDVGAADGLMTLPARTIGELAQFFANRSRKTVRVPRELAGREFRHLGRCAPTFVLEALKV